MLDVGERLAGVDILINNAAVMFRFLDEPRTPFWEVPLAEFELVQRVNVTGSWLCAKAVFGPMRCQGSGKIVNISSNMAQGTELLWPAKMAAYTTSKAGVIGLTRALAGEAGTSVEPAPPRSMPPGSSRARPVRTASP